MFTGRGSGHPVSAPGGLAGLLKKPHSVRAGVGPAQHSARSLVGKPADVGWLCPPPPQLYRLAHAVLQGIPQRTRSLLSCGGKDNVEKTTSGKAPWYRHAEAVSRPSIKSLWVLLRQGRWDSVGPDAPRAGQSTTYSP